MARLHADPVSTALMHPTRRALYVALLEADEYTTVQLQNLVNVDRYNLYHHLRKLESLGLVMNHRDQGRTRWWCVMDRVPLPSDGSSATEDDTIARIDLSNPRVQATAKRLIRELGSMTGQNLELDGIALESIDLKGRKNS